jgi:hypothetical protein
MREFRFEQAFDRHPEIQVGLVSVRYSAQRFETGGSVAGLLRRMGPFIAKADAFSFGNDFAITPEQAAEFLGMVTDKVIDAVVDTTVGLYVEKLSSIDLDPLPLFETGIPDEVIDYVADLLAPEVAAVIHDSVATPIGSGFGRCGGMAFAGYDFYRARWRIDDSVTMPPTEGPLGAYIYERLLDSLRLNIGRFVDWTVRLHGLANLDEIATALLGSAVGTVVGGPIGALIGAYIGGQVDVFDLGRGAAVLLEPTKREWTLLKEILDHQAAWPIGLIYGDKKWLWEQHQVLAVGYKDKGAGQGTLYIWDNKDGNAQSSVSLDFRGDELQAAGRHPNLKGFFCDQYEWQRPPQALFKG